MKPRFSSLIEIDFRTNQAQKYTLFYLGLVQTTQCFQKIAQITSYAIEILLEKIKEILQKVLKFQGEILQRLSH